MTADRSACWIVVYDASRRAHKVVHRSAIVGAVDPVDAFAFLTEAEADARQRDDIAQAAERAFRKLQRPLFDE